MGAAGKRDGENKNQHEQTLVVTIEPEGVDEIAQEGGVYHYEGNSEPQGHGKVNNLTYTVKKTKTLEKVLDVLLTGGRISRSIRTQ